MGDSLSLQGLEIDVVETPAEEYRSDNSVYACTLLSMHSVAC
ncbi:MAG: hypothetical protein ACK5MT_18545 [Actinomycetales bacterium]